MAESAQWSARQLEVLQALEVPLYLRRQPASAVVPASEPGTAEVDWCLQARAAQLPWLQQQRWYLQLCRYRAPSAPTMVDDAPAAIILDGLALTLEGEPARPSAELKRLIYQALRPARSTG